MIDKGQWWSRFIVRPSSGIKCLYCVLGDLLSLKGFCLSASFCCWDVRCKPTTPPPPSPSEATEHKLLNQWEKGSSTVMGLTLKDPRNKRRRGGESDLWADAGDYIWCTHTHTQHTHTHSRGAAEHQSLQCYSHASLLREKETGDYSSGIT